ncbi:hypothetical protein C8R43DRAFT_949297 [Mycena crocata]|nr:hypothetical protein C8R43DRAFT_949297 [Mycena crocata]
MAGTPIMMLGPEGPDVAVAVADAMTGSAEKKGRRAEWGRALFEMHAKEKRGYPPFGASVDPLLTVLGFGRWLSISSFAPRSRTSSMLSTVMSPRVSFKLANNLSAEFAVKNNVFDGRGVGEDSDDGGEEVRVCDESSALGITEGVDEDGGFKDGVCGGGGGGDGAGMYEELPVEAARYPSGPPTPLQSRSLCSAAPIGASEKVRDSERAYEDLARDHMELLGHAEDEVELFACDYAEL